MMGKGRDNPSDTKPRPRGHTNNPWAFDTNSARHLRPCDLPKSVHTFSGLKTDGDAIDRSPSVGLNAVYTTGIRSSGATAITSPEQEVRA